MSDNSKPVRGAGAGQARRVLLAWEMGEGFGHASRLLTLARLLKKAGWLPVVAARNPHALAERHAAANIPVIATPPHRSCFTGPGRFRAASFADIMGVCGYADPVQLAHMVNAWDAVLREQRPHVVIADYSPLLALAAFGRVPIIAVGDGFVTPPGLADGHFPALRDAVPAVWDPAVLLNAAQRVQTQRGLPLPVSLPQIMAGRGQVTAVPRELDIYAALRPVLAAGPWESARPPLPAPGRSQVFVYLHMDHPLARRVLQALVDCRVPGECYLHAMTPEIAALLAQSALKVHLQPPPLRAALEQASLLIHHGGIGALEEALQAGRPQLLLPRHLEQALNVRQALGAKAGIFSLSPNASLEQLRKRLPTLLNNTTAMAAAQTAATKLWARQDNAWQALQSLLASVDVAPAASRAVRAATIEDEYARGNRLHRQGRLAEARQIYDEVLRRDPAHIGARVDRANARRDLGDPGGAETDLRTAIAANPANPKILQSLGHLLRIVGRLEEATDCLRRALAINEIPSLHWQLAYTLLLMGHYQQAWPHFEHRHAALKLRTANPAKPRWDGGPVTSSTLLVLDEQGLGDTLQFLRFLPLIPIGPGGRIIFAGKPATLPVVRRLLPSADVVSWDGPLPSSQCWVPLMSLPERLGVMTPEDLPAAQPLPGLLTEPERVSRWRPLVRGVVDGTPVVALCWRGNPDFSGDNWRSPGLAALTPLLDIAGVRFVSLQVGTGVQEIESLGLGQHIIDIGSSIEAEGTQVLDTLAALASCDFAISSCTSIAHMAGLAGIPGCVLLSNRPDWRWMTNRTDSPWYPSLQLVRQSVHGDWTAVVLEAAEHLRRWRSEYQAAQDQ